MSRADPQVNFRIPAELLEKLRGASELNNRTLTAELVSRLEASFAQPIGQVTLDNATAERLIEALKLHLAAA